MNNTFSFKRFFMLLNKHTVEHYRIYLMALGVFAGLLSVVLGIFAYSNAEYVNSGSQFGIFLTFFLFSGCIFTSMIFADLGDKRKAIAMLTLPASSLEKYLVAWFYSFVIFQLVFVGCFYAIDAVFLNVANARRAVPAELINLLGPEYNRIFSAYAILHSICFFGAVFFDRFHLIKTASSFFLFGLILFFLNNLIANSIFDVKIFQSPPFSNLGIEENKVIYTVEPLAVTELYINYMAMVMVGILWLGAYFKLKEREV